MTSVNPNPGENLVSRSPNDGAVQHAAEEPLSAGEDVVSAAQILVSYLWNSEYDRASSNHTSHIFQQLRTLTRWLTTTPGE